MPGIAPKDKLAWLPGPRNGIGTLEEEEGLLESICKDKLSLSPLGLGFLGDLSIFNNNINRCYSGRKRGFSRHFNSNDIIRGNFNFGGFEWFLIKTHGSFLSIAIIHREVVFKITIILRVFEKKIRVFFWENWISSQKSDSKQVSRTFFDFFEFFHRKQQIKHFKKPKPNFALKYNCHI